MKNIMKFFNWGVVAIFSMGPAIFTGAVLTTEVVSPPALAGPSSQEQFVKQNSDLMSHAKTLSGYVDSASLSKEVRTQIKVWAKIKGASKIPKVTVHDSNFVFELKGKKATLAFLDYDKHLMTLNDKPFELEKKMTVSENLDHILEVMDPQHSISFSFMSIAEANWQLSAVDIGGAAVIGVLAYSLQSQDASPASP